MKTYYRTPEVAAILGVKEQTVREMTCTYRIPHRKLPKVRGVLYPADEIADWIDDPTIPLDVRRGKDGSRVVRQVAA